MTRPLRECSLPSGLRLLLHLAIVLLTPLACGPTDAKLRTAESFGGQDSVPERSSDQAASSTGKSTPPRGVAQVGVETSPRPNVGDPGRDDAIGNPLPPGAPQEPRTPEPPPNELPKFEAGTTVINFNSEVFPPLLRKVGYNGNWNKLDSADRVAAESAAEAQVSIAAGLLEVGDANEERGPTATVGDQPIFRKDTSGAVVTRLDPELLSLRQDLSQNRMLNLLQIAGTPTNNSGFKVDPRATATGNGNFYPLPIKSEVPDLAKAFGQYARDLVLRDQLATLWAFWQEPNHTIDNTLSGEEQLLRYFDLHKQVAAEIRANNRDAMIVGVQQNASAGISPKGAIDGADYLKFANLLQETERKEGGEYPLDLLTLQIYKGESGNEILQNSRIAFQPERFSMSPLLINEWDYDKNDNFVNKYETGSGIPKLLNALMPWVLAPDVHAVLLKRNIFSNRALSFRLMKFLSEMPTRRGQITFAAPQPEGVQGLASASSSSARILFWNSSARDHELNLGFVGLSPQLRGQNVKIETLSDENLSREEKIGENGQLLARVVIPSGRAVLIRIGDVESKGNGLSRSVYARHFIHSPRKDEGKEPDSLGHFEFRTSTLFAASRDASGVGASGVILRKVPDDASSVLKVQLNLSRPLVAEDDVAVRFDFLEGAAVTKTYQFAWRNPEDISRWSSLTRWTPLGTRIGGSLSGESPLVSLPIREKAPATWTAADGAARRIQISIVTRGSTRPLTVSAALSDAP